MKRAVIADLLGDVQCEAIASVIVAFVIQTDRARVTSVLSLKQIASVQLITPGLCSNASQTGRG